MGIVLAFFYKGEVWYEDENENRDENEDENENENEDDIDPVTQRPYWDVPEPDKDDLTVRYRFRK